MSDWLLLIIGYILGAPLGFLLCTVIVSGKDYKNPHITCKDCAHRNKKECPLSHIDCDVTGDCIFWHTDKPDNFYCKEAQKIVVGQDRKQKKL